MELKETSSNIKSDAKSVDITGAKKEYILFDIGSIYDKDELLKNVSKSTDDVIAHYFMPTIPMLGEEDKEINLKAIQEVKANGKNRQIRRF